MYSNIVSNPHNYPEELGTININILTLQIWETICIH